MTTAPDIIRSAYAEYIVTDLAASRGVLRRRARPRRDPRGRERALPARVRGVPAPLARAAEGAGRRPGRARLPGALRRRMSNSRPSYFTELGCRVERRAAGATRGIGDAVRVEDPLGFPIEFFYEAEHVERFTRRYDVHGAGAISRLDHFNIVTPDVPRRPVATTSRPRLQGVRGHPGPGADASTPPGCTARRPCTTSPSPAGTGRGCTTSRSDPRAAPDPEHLRPPRRPPPVRQNRARARPARRLQCVLPLPARPGRAPDRDLHPRLLHRRPGQPGADLGRARQPAPGLVGQPGRAELVRRGVHGARPRRQPEADRRPDRNPGGRHHDRCRRLLLHPAGGGRVQARQPG